MGVVAGTEDALAAKFAVLFPHLDERQRRLLMGAEARILGHGGIRTVARGAADSPSRRDSATRFSVGQGPVTTHVTSVRDGTNGVF